MQSFSRDHRLLLLALIILLAPQDTLARSKKLLQYLPPMVPKFDTPEIAQRAPFKIKIKHTDVIFPEDPKVLLHGTTKVVDLSADKNDGMLHGAVSDENQQSTIDTVEHGVKPKFYVDLRKLAAKYAPDIEWMMETEIAAARRRAAGDASRQEKRMERELKARAPQAAAPSLPARVEANPELTRALDAEIAQTKQRKQKEEESAAKQLDSALASAKAGAEKMPGFPSLPFLMAPEMKSAPELKTPQMPKANTSASEKQMAQALVKANLKTPSEAELTAEMERAKKHAQIAVKQAKPAMDMILTSMRQVPSMHFPTAAEAEAEKELDGPESIKWDKWHSHFAELASNPILKAVAAAGNPSGSNTVEITVMPNHHIDVRLTQSGNSEFDKAIVRAYQSLDQNSELAYPAGSRRSAVTFLIDNKHTGLGVPTGVKSQTSIDTEVLRQRLPLNK